MKKLAIVLAGLLLMAATAAMAEVPKTINYQARLTDLAGNPIVDGTHSVTFRLYDSVSALETESKWVDTFSVQTKNGFFNVLLGSAIPFPAGLDLNQKYWLGIRVDTDAEMTERLPLASVLFAIKAEIADYASTAVNAMNIADNCVTSTKLASDSVVASKIQDGAVSTQAKAPWAATVYSNGSQILSPKIACGSVTSNVSGDVTINFPFTYLGGNPHVILTVLNGTANGKATIEAIYNNHCDIHTWFENGSGILSKVGPISVEWVAIGN